MRKLEGQIKNIVIDGPPSSGKSSIVNNLGRTLLGVQLDTFFAASEECIADTLDGKDRIVVDGGPLSRIIDRKNQGEDFEEEKPMEDSTLLVCLYTDPAELVARAGDDFIDLDLAKELMERYMEEFQRYPAKNKMVVDSTFLPSNITVRSILWAVNKRVRS